MGAAQSKSADEIIQMARTPVAGFKPPLGAVNTVRFGGRGG